MGSLPCQPLPNHLICSCTMSVSAHSSHLFSHYVSLCPTISSVLAPYQPLPIHHICSCTISASAHPSHLFLHHASCDASPTIKSSTVSVSSQSLRPQLQATICLKPQPQATVSVSASSHSLRPLPQPLSQATASGWGKPGHPTPAGPAAAAAPTSPSLRSMRPWDTHPHPAAPPC